jgi:hypothetical protein
MTLGVAETRRQEARAIVPEGNHPAAQARNGRGRRDTGRNGGSAPLLRARAEPLAYATGIVTKWPGQKLARGARRPAGE